MTQEEELRQLRIDHQVLVHQRDAITANWSDAMDRLAQLERWAQLQMDCTRCLAAPGEWCVTRRGRLARYIHAARWRAVRAIEDEQ